jgi:hypothetical protein
LLFASLFSFHVETSVFAQRQLDLLCHPFDGAFSVAPNRLGQLAADRICQFHPDRARFCENPSFFNRSSFCENPEPL